MRPVLIPFSPASDSNMRWHRSLLVSRVRASAFTTIAHTGACRRHDLLSLVMGEARGKLEAQAAEYVTDDNMLRRTLLAFSSCLRSGFCMQPGTECRSLQNHTRRACQQLASGS